MARGISVYRVNRWRIGLSTPLYGGLAWMALSPWLLDAVRAGYVRPLKYLPPDVRVLLIQGLGLLLIASTIAIARFLFDDRAVFIDAEGIEVRHPFAVHRARWCDFADMKATGRRTMGALQLRFSKAPGFRSKVNLPIQFLGVDTKTVIVDALFRVASLQDAPPPPHRPTPEQSAPRVPPSALRSFGKRAGTSG